MAGFASVTVTATSVMKTVGVSTDVTPNAAFSSTSNKSRTLDGWDSSVSLTSATTPAVGNGIYTRVTLSGGAATLDLTAISQVDGNTYDATGKKLVTFRFGVKGTNLITVAGGASNGYLLYGTGGKVTVYPGECNEQMPQTTGNAAARPTVDSTHKTIDFGGTGADVIDCTLVFST